MRFEKWRLGWVRYVGRMDITYKEMYVYTGHLVLLRTEKRKRLRWVGYVARMDITTRNCVNTQFTWYSED